MLAGQTLPDPNVLERLAEAVRVPLAELLVRSGVISRKSSVSVETAASRQSDAGPLTPPVAARQLGIRDPENIAFFERTVQMLLDRERG